MKLEEMRKIASEATEGEISTWGLRIPDPGFAPDDWYIVEEEGVDLSLCAIAPKEKARFIAMARNKIDKLLDVLKIAKQMKQNAGFTCDCGCYETWDDLEKAIEEAEKE